ncbi:DOMON domain protein (macronuclear) [Tetrahymena thermophila SB210]|uniref:DOMON domain protein n=1 Tax=Tetrahymena thermophila (strain SB210) TaxID=312017 RepID=Q23Q28_TETTS|nr:DOMON domain protein [Tetrahymena thermophila SB210]EAR98507.1 DOMON domain protein [Tetrahymena thermophila SB210]|eukprot:XP_001018752.1 DOMON domain protein [Tetrahymena thermophila SB210]
MKFVILSSLLVVCTLTQVTNQISLSNGFVLNYQIASPNISFTLTGSNKGYVALGFGGSGMDSIDVAAFKWDGTQVVGEDRTNLDNKKKVDLDVNNGCINNLTVDPTSTYDSSTGNWNIIFSRPLNTNEPNCDQIIQADTAQNLAFAIFKDFTWQKHSSSNFWTLTLSSGTQNDPSLSGTQNGPSLSSLLIQYSYYLTLLYMLMIFV